ncbi:unnamed protein product [Arabidopsis lyrata]|uniref:Predicted protein n=1 Tax=Arabidopsis lyrata subsp. lyrata TaxID=81972 RepID=D7LER4_ARALL|nr:predicted protein [Arabidopsis lyrata subsp. lyrata]CAH8263745.1 unnamed protein product [Arabidopsis lyrata]
MALFSIFLLSLFKFFSQQSHRKYGKNKTKILSRHPRKIQTLFCNIYDCELRSGQTNAKQMANQRPKSSKGNARTVDHGKGACIRKIKCFSVKRENSAQAKPIVNHSQLVETPLNKIKY